MVEQVGQRQVTVALGGAAFAHGQQRAQPPVGRAVGGVDQHLQPRRVVAGLGDRQLQPAADGEGQTGFFGRRVGPHHPGQAVAVGDGQPAVTQRRGALHQLVGVAGPGEEGEVGGAVEFGVGVVGVGGVRGRGRHAFGVSGVEGVFGWGGVGHVGEGFRC